MLLTSILSALVANSYLASALPAAKPIFHLEEPTFHPSRAESPQAGGYPPSSDTYWVSKIKRQGAPAFGPAGFKVFRNVKDYGAKGDGTTDDTVAINTAISDGNRCGLGCDSTTTTPVMVYFPPGTYLVSAPIVQYYITQLVGDALSFPTLKAAANFEGIGVIDADPYAYVNGTAVNWYGNTNNFYRQIRNFVIDLTGIANGTGAGIHWQVAQATSLQNIRFKMIKGDSKQQGIFMDNGSGGFMSDLTFEGGNIAMFVGNQQFTTRNIKISDCNTGVFMNWNWLWSMKGFTINNCKVGLDMANNPTNQTVGSVLLLDSAITNCQLGVNSSFTADSIPAGGGTLIIDNADFSGTGTAVAASNGDVVLGGNRKIDNFIMGRTYTQSLAERTVGPVTGPNKPEALVTDDGNVFERSKPQYEQYPASAFVSVKECGVKGDGSADDTAAIQAAVNKLRDGQILYFDHGNYKVTSTIKIPGDRSIKITGEVWPVIMATGSFFADENNPQPVLQIGQVGDVGSVEISDLVLSTIGPVPGAVLFEWNSNAKSQGSNGMWDVHTRIGGFAGTQLQSDKCSKNPNVIAAANPACIAAHTLFHATQDASVYLENNWFWVADHELDRSDHTQINIFNGRGVLLENKNAMWLYGTASEHNVFYQYQLNNAENVYMSVIQTETPYFQPNPAAPGPFAVQKAISDPEFTGEASAGNMAWGLRVIDSSDVLVYGAGIYSFFDNYGQACVSTQTCQNDIVSIEGNISNLWLSGLSTKASVNMVSTNGFRVQPSGPAAALSRAVEVSQVSVLDADNRSNFCATVALWRPS